MFAIPDPVVLKIHQYYFLESLLRDFPSMLKDWQSKEIHLIRKDAQVASEGDDIIEESIYSQYSSCIYEQTDYEEHLFSQAIFMMVFSYYESIVHKMAIDCGTQDRPSVICQRHGKTLSMEAVTASETIYREARILRNYLCHNNAGTESESEAKETRMVLEKLEARGSINMEIVRGDDGQVLIGQSLFYNVNTHYTLEILKKEYLVLRELAVTCGYTNRLN